MSDFKLPSMMSQLPQQRKNSDPEAALAHRQNIANFSKQIRESRHEMYVRRNAPCPVDCQRRPEPVDIERGLRVASIFTPKFPSTSSAQGGVPKPIDYRKSNFLKQNDSPGSDSELESSSDRPKEDHKDQLDIGRPHDRLSDSSSDSPSSDVEIPQADSNPDVNHQRNSNLGSAEIPQADSDDNISDVEEETENLHILNATLYCKTKKEVETHVFHFDCTDQVNTSLNLK